MAHVGNAFGVGCATEIPVGEWDDVCLNVQIICSTKSFLVFSFLFGLSFFLQLDRAATRGVQFLGRFCWRLVLLALFGLVDAFFYPHDILVTFAVCGFLLVLLWRAPNWLVFLLIGICAIAPWYINHYAPQTHDLMAQYSADAVRLLGGPEEPADYQNASIGEIAFCNYYRVLVKNWFVMVKSEGRIWGMLIMFMLGLLAGRYRIFEGNNRRWWVVSVVGAALYIWLKAIGEYNNITRVVALVVAAIPFMVWLLGRPWLGRLVYPLTQIGRCTLTCYIMQNVVMRCVLCGYGLGLRPTLSLTELTLLALALYAVQVVFCVVWLRFFRYGPLESIWRKLTRLGMSAPRPQAEQ